MFADIIRNASTEQEIFFLLTSYIDSLKQGDKQQCMSEPVTRLPLNNVADLRGRFEQLMIDLDAASKRLDDKSCTVIREGAHILGTALNRLELLSQYCFRPQDVSAAGMDARAA